MAKTVTEMTSLLGSGPLLANSPGPKPVLDMPVYMDKTGDISLQYESDEQRWSRLMVNAQAGDESDYRTLLTELTQVIHGFLRNRFGNGDFIEDCVQETLIAIHQARHTYDRHRPFRAWLFAIVRHKAIDVLRQQRTRQNTASRYRDTQEVLAQQHQHNEAEHEMMQSRLLESLPETHREVLILTKLIGLSVAETAEKLGISQSLVKVRVHRAIRKLRTKMEAETL